MKQVASDPTRQTFSITTNGVTFISETAVHDQFCNKLTLTKAQVVNGGQTIRAIHRAFSTGSLKDDVKVVARAITSRGDKEFSSDVAVNQNNQNKMEAGFLRSNDPRVVQLAHSLASIGWYFEKREGEVGLLTPTERATVETRIGKALSGRVIKLKEGTQAYVATFFEQPELAKKNPKKMFLSANDGGFFEDIFSSDMTAQKLAIAHQVKNYVDDFVTKFMIEKRKKDKATKSTEYRSLLGDEIIDQFSGTIEQVMPQSAIFLCGTIFQDLVQIQKKPADELPAVLKAGGIPLMREHIFRTMTFARENPQHAAKSWPTLLKSNQFFRSVVTYIRGVRATPFISPLT
ncbi:MAG: AIPR family protein [Planctomycetia bacterium]|nr:AIPR family protein [Planctomycetia bacterium]